MTLDISRIARQIEDLVATLDPERDRTRFDALREVWISLDSREVNQRMASAKTSFLLARCHGDYRERFELPELPEGYTVAATDGSMIVPDRHSPARFYLINIGKVLLRYGVNPSASLTSDPDLRFSDDDLWFRTSARRIPVDETIVGLRRATAELQAAAELIEDEAGPALALQDGTLILWSLMGKDPIVVDSILPDYLKALRVFRERGQPIASYISAPGASDLMNTMRVAVCDYPLSGLTINCDDCRMRFMVEDRLPRCEILPGVPDRYLVEHIAKLQPGQRTRVFDSDSSILDRYDADLRTCFFYLHSGREIARIEIPRWVADDAHHIDLVQAAIVDQCRLGLGYPVALQEAHEQAVLNMADRRIVESTIERRLAGMGIVMMRTGKDLSKRARFI